MKYCMRCGICLNDDVKVCPHCGLPQPMVTWNVPPVMQNTYSHVNALQPLLVKKKEPNKALPFFIWSVILFFIINPIGSFLAIAGALFSAMSNSEQGEKNLHRLRVSKALCIITTVIDGLTLIALFVLTVLKILNLPF